MKEVRQPTEKCEEFNKRNAEAIAAGLVEGITPTKEILDREAYVRKMEEEKKLKEAEMVKVLDQIYMALPDHYKKRYVNPTVKYVSNYNGVEFNHTPGFDYYTPNVEIEKFRSDTTGERYNRVVVGCYGDKKMVKIKNTVATKDEVTRAIQNVINAVDAADTKAAKEALNKAAAEKKKNFAAANPDFLKAMNLSSYDNWQVEDGKITIHYQHTGLGSTHTFTVEQWLEYVEFRNQYIAQRKALVERFESTNKAVT